MTVENPRVIDGMGIDKMSGEVVLTVADHLDWADERGHLEALQAKTNAYLDFVESGQVYEHSSAKEGMPIRIDVIAKFEIPENVRWFFDAANEAAEKNGVTFTARHLPAGY